jgi:hypothetical protein
MATHKPINILEAFAAAPPPLDYVLPNMVAGTVGALVSPGGAGKSMLALQLAAQIAGGPDLLEVGELPTGPVIYLPAEDPPTAIHHRLHALGAHLSAEERQAVADGLLIQPLIGSLPNIMAPEWFDGLKRAAEGRRLMVLDTLRRFHIEEENASGPMAQVIGRMEAIAADTGCSIVFLHHASKGAAMMGAGDQQQASRGSSVLVDNIRWQSYLSSMTSAEAEEWGVDDDQRLGFFVRFGVSKANYGAPFADRWFRRHDGGVLKPAVLERQRKSKGCPVVKPKNKHSLSHVRHDPAHCLAPGLFRALKRGERKRSKLDVTYDYGDGKRIEFSGPEPLGADDLRILQGLVAMAGPNGLVLGPEPKTEGGRQLRLFLEPKWEAVTADAMVVKGSYRALAKEIGAEVDSGGALKHIQDCIERLWKVSIIAQNGRKRQGFRLLSEYASDEADGRLYVALNPLIAQAVMGGGQHVRISMDEVRALDSETARLLHQRLCGWIDPGKTGKASRDTLCGYVWPSEASGSTMRKRRQRVREALPELVALGWTVTEFAAGKYDITRPKAAG